jgi:integrase
MKILFWLNQSNIIYCRITIGGKRAEISTGLKTNSLSAGRTGDNIIDCRLAEIEYKLRKIQMMLDINGTGYGSSDVKAIYEKGQVRLPTPRLLDIMQRKDKIYLASITHLKDFLNVENPKLSELDQAFANRFADHLLDRTKPSSAKIYFSKVAASIRQAISDHPKQSYPDMIVEMPFERPESLTQQSEQGLTPKYLTRAQYESLLALELDDNMGFYRLCFTWQCLTGMAMADINKFSEDLVYNDISGKQYIRYERVKTTSEAVVPVTSDIIKLYLLFPLALSERKYNYHLKQIGAMIGIPNMTSHYGRHTFGTMKLTEGFSMESVSKMMGHTSIKTTERHYAKVTTEKIFKEMEMAGI